MSAEKQPMREKSRKDELIWQCRLSSLYHEYREGFLDFCHRLVFFAIITSSALLVLGLFGSSPKIVTLLTLLPAISASLDLVLKFSIGAQTHNFLKRRFYHLEARLTGNKISDKTLEEVEKEMVQLMADEPPGYRVLLCHCSNLMDIENDEEPRLQISKPKMLLRNVYRFTGTPPPQIEKQKN